MASRADVDLWLILTDPEEARKYIAAFDWSCPPEYRPNHIVLESGREIYFSIMSDEDAVIAATAILRDVEIPIVLREKNLIQWEH